jgi:hypothetical protein
MIKPFCFHCQGPFVTANLWLCKEAQFRVGYEPGMGRKVGLNGLMKSVGYFGLEWKQDQKQTNSVALSPRANYTD